MPIWLSEPEVRALLPMRDLISQMGIALAAYSAGRVRQPVRSVIEIPISGSFYAVMPALAPDIPAMGAKLVTVYPNNTLRGIPSHLATILLLSPDTGELLAILDGRFITEARTAAVSAVAVQLLATQPAPVLAILGAGVQAASHLEALPLVRNFSEIRCWSRTPSSTAALAARFPVVRPVDTAEGAVRDADVIALVTASTEPVIRSEWVKPGACVVAVGACRPTHREMDSDLVSRARLVVDARASALAEAGDIVIPIREGRFAASHIAAELGELVSQTGLGRQSQQQVIVFKSLGLAVEDLAAAHLVYQRARQLGRGMELA